ncbi:hypothetical protein QVD17_31104 [Tagetes erecta]|uniref:Peptidase M48 domain-containing protein n=1 Tax=Tagetes erecta TaxID=13708 RepID=A0AAD8K2R5_TARER|nr:hypothetical protein QVD17_31104 [Tagetes erecta]
MALYNRLKLGFDAISRHYTSKITSHKPRFPYSIIDQLTNHRRLISGSGSQCRSFGTSYRCHHVVSKLRMFKRWIDHNPDHAFIGLSIGSGIGITIWFGNVETIPYTKRNHVVLIPHNVERMVGDWAFKMMKGRYKGQVLPETDPKSVRVRKIGKDIVEALQRGLKKEEVWRDLNCKGVKLGTLHLEGLKWEIIVVNEPVVNAGCFPGGKIVVFAGLLDHFKTDEEVALILGHEVAHAVGRHWVETITKHLWFTIGRIIMYQYVKPDHVESFSKLLLELPFSRKMEIEADHIGLLLMASAGYDPRVAPTVLKKLGQVSGDSGLEDYVSTHPSGKKRSKLLSEASVMQEAVFAMVHQNYGFMPSLAIYYTSKITPHKSPFRYPNSIVNHNYNHFSSSFTSTSNHQITLTTKNSSFSSAIANKSSQFRCYHADPLHSKPCRWIDDPDNVLFVVLVGLGIGVTIWFGNVETVPYTKRNRLVVIPHNLERWIGDYVFEKMKDYYEGKVSHDTNAKSVRVRMIWKDIVDALHGGFKKEEVWKDLNYEGVKLTTSHLEGLKWEILVVEDDSVKNAFCLPGGKIVVYSGSLDCYKSFKTDDATIIGHEQPYFGTSSNAFFLPKSVTCRMEIEADYIGMMLMASAGYDPQVAPKLFTKLGQVSGDSGLEDYLSTHPSGKKRSKLLSEASVMQEAISIYQEVIAGKEVDA